MCKNYPRFKVLNSCRVKILDFVESVTILCNKLEKQIVVHVLYIFMLTVCLILCSKKTTLLQWVPLGCVWNAQQDYVTIRFSFKLNVSH